MAIRERSSSWRRVSEREGETEIEAIIGLPGILALMLAVRDEQDDFVMKVAIGATIDGHADRGAIVFTVGTTSVLLSHDEVRFVARELREPLTLMGKLPAGMTARDLERFKAVVRCIQSACADALHLAERHTSGAAVH